MYSFPSIAARSAAAPLVAAPRQRLLHSTASLALAALALCATIALAPAAGAQGLPTGGAVAAGQATISGDAASLTINQTSPTAVLNWQSFDVAAGKTVAFVQPGSSSVALNRVLGPDASAIFGTVSANGKLFLVNPNGVLFGKGAQVNAAALVASTLDISDSDFAAGRYAFSGAGRGAVVNQGTINADGGYVALLGATVSNQGIIQANMGMVALAAGEALTLDLAGDGLLNVTVATGAVAALVENGGLLRADGGQVLMTAQAAGTLLKTAVNNSGTIEARTLENRSGVIRLLGDMQGGTMTVAGTLDAQAPHGGDGGFIETSAAHVDVSDGARVTTAAATGTPGSWLIDPQDFIVGAGGNISGATLSAQLVTTSIIISTLASAGDGTAGNGDIFVNDAVSWTASGVPTTLTLNAVRDVNINAAITATNGNLVACCGRDINVNAPITTTNGSVLLNAGRDVNVFHAIVTTDGNIALCAGHDLHIDAAVTLTRGTTIPAQSLGLPVGLTLIAGAEGTGPGAGGGTLIFAPLAPPITVTVAPTTISYNPVSYAAPTDFSTRFVRTEGASLTQRMLLFPTGDKVFDGSSSTVLAGFNTTAISGVPAGVSLVAGPAATATFDAAAVGTLIGITYSGYSLGGADAGLYALAGSCCVSTFRSRGTIAAAAALPPGVTPPLVTPPVVTPPAVTPVTPILPVAPVPGVVPPAGPPGVAPPVVVVTPVVTPPAVVAPVVTPVVVAPIVAPVTPPVVVAPVAPPALVAAVLPTSGTMQTEASALPTALAALPLGAALAIVGGGVNVPTDQLALAAPQAPALPVGPTPEERAEAAREARAPIVYAPKQARN